VSAIGKNTNILLVSDHGAGKYRGNFYVNSWLREKGLLKTSKRKTTKGMPILGDLVKLVDGESHEQTYVERMMSFLGTRGITAEGVERLLRKLRISFIRKILPVRVLRNIPRRGIDWENSRAYCEPTCFGIRINLKGRDPAGVVNPGEEYESLKNDIIERLKKVKDPAGLPLFEKVLPKEEYYSGPEIDKAPDILLVTRDMNYQISDSIFDDLFFSHDQYFHKKDGLFVAYGPDIKEDGPLGFTPSLLDIAPTVLHMMDVPVPEDMDGRVLKEIFKEGTEPALREVVFQKEASDEAERIRERVKRLKELGKV
jgi:predicted AlkP superfamily phosphohydrolase/phosphomutase